MKVYELAKELGIESKELLSTLNEIGYDVKNHMSQITEEQEEVIRSAFEEEKVEEPVVEEVQEEPVIVKSVKKFANDDLIPCKCVKPNKVVWYSTKTGTRYEWSGFGDVVDVLYTDLLAMKSSKSAMLFKPLIIIEDMDLYEQWKKDLEPIYKLYSGLDYPEKLFDMNNVLFKAKLTNSPKAIGELVKITATKMIKEGTFNSLDKLRIIDEVLGTCLKDFI